MVGWIKVYRPIKQHWIWQDAERLKWWIDILLSVNHEAQKVLIKGTVVTCDRGQSIRSLDSWAQDWRTTKKTVRNFFLLLQKDEMIVYESVSVSTRITVCKYDSYQEIGNVKETLSKRRVNAKETEPTPKQEGEEGKERKEVKKAVRDNVLLSKTEYEKLVANHGVNGTDWMLDKLSAYKLSKNKTYASDYGAINTWVIDSYKSRIAVGGIPDSATVTPYLQPNIIKPLRDVSTEPKL